MQFLTTSEKKIIQPKTHVGIATVVAKDLTYICTVCHFFSVSGRNMFTQVHDWPENERLWLHLKHPTSHYYLTCRGCLSVGKTVNLMKIQLKSKIYPLLQIFQEPSSWTYWILCWGVSAPWALCLYPCSILYRC